MLCRIGRRWVWGLGAAGLCLAGWAGHGRVVAAQSSTGGADWPAYNGGVSGNHYSKLEQINPSNVGRLKMAWRYDAGVDGGLQANPLVVGGVLYGYDSRLHVFALDGASGMERWRFDSGVAGDSRAGG